jgi:hypothetical protein
MKFKQNFQSFHLLQGFIRNRHGGEGENEEVTGAWVGEVKERLASLSLPNLRSCREAIRAAVQLTLQGRSAMLMTEVGLRAMAWHVKSIIPRLTTLHCLFVPRS